MRILYNNEYDTKPFDFERFYKSVSSYGEVDKEELEARVNELTYDPMHYSVLVEVGTAALKDDDAARAYYEDHKIDGRKFERLRRITGYLVGSLERWNDAKQAEERERVKHNVENYSLGKR